MTYAQLQGFLADWAIVNCGLIAAPDAAALIYEKTEGERSESEQNTFVLMNSVVFWVGGNGPRPNRNYITLHLQSIPSDGLPYHSLADGNGDQTIHYTENVSLEIKSYGPNTEDNLRSLKQSVMYESVLEKLRVNGIVVRGDTPIVDVGASFDFADEGRYAYEITFGIGQEITERVGYIATSPVGQTILPPA